MYIHKKIRTLASVAFTFFLFVTATSIATKTSTATASRLVLGAIQFPESVVTIPTVRIYYGGRQIVPTIEDETKQLIFSIPKGTNQNSLYVLISTDVTFSSLKNKRHAALSNPVGYLKLAPGKPYRLFELTLTQQTPSENSADKKTAEAQKDESSGVSAWTVREATLTSEDLRLPDMTITVCYPPAFVESIEPQADAFSLPTIMVKNNVIELAGSTEKFAELSNNLLLATLDLDTIHEMQVASTKMEAGRILIAAPLA